MHFYVEARLKKSSLPSNNVAYMLVLTVHILIILFLYCLPLVEWYMNDIDKSWGLSQCLGFAASYVTPVFAIHYLWFSGRNWIAINLVQMGNCS